MASYVILSFHELLREDGVCEEGRREDEQRGKGGREVLQQGLVWKEERRKERDNEAR